MTISKSLASAMSISREQLNHMGAFGAPAADRLNALEQAYADGSLTRERYLALIQAAPGAALPTAPAERKDTNPKDAVGTKKVPLASVVPARVIGEVSLAMLEGAREYGRHNYRIAGVRASVYVDAQDRHMKAFWEGQDIDPKSGLSHVTKAIASLIVLRDSMMQGNWVDDRPPAVEGDWVAEQNVLAAGIIARIRPDDPAAPYTQEGLDRGDYGSSTEQG